MIASSNYAYRDCILNLILDSVVVVVGGEGYGGCGAGSRIYKPGYNHAFQTKILVVGGCGGSFRLVFPVSSCLSCRTYSHCPKHIGKIGRFKDQHHAGQPAGQSSCDPSRLNKLSSLTHYHCIDRAIKEKSIWAIIFRQYLIKLSLAFKDNFHWFIISWCFM